MEAIVRFFNDGKKTFEDQYGTVPYICPPGEKILVPFEAVCLWFGNGEIQDRPALSQYDRRDEVHRVRTRMGAVVLEAEGKPFIGPKFHVETLEGERVWTAYEDPNSTKAPVSSINAKGLDDREAVAQELEIVKRQQAELLRRLEELQNPVTQTLDDIADDTPTKVPVGKP